MMPMEGFDFYGSSPVWFRGLSYGQYGEVGGEKKKPNKQRKQIRKIF